MRVGMARALADFGLKSWNFVVGPLTPLADDRKQAYFQPQETAAFIVKGHRRSQDLVLGWHWGSSLPLPCPF